MDTGLAGRMVLVEPPHPPLDFPIVGLADPAGQRWVDLFEGMGGEPVWSVRLGHLTAAGVTYVCTAPRERWNTAMSFEAEQGVADFAMRWLLPLMDISRPPLDEATNTEYTRRVITFAIHEAASWSAWEPATWTVDDQPVPARVYRFGKAWVGVAVSEPMGYLAVTAYEQSGTTVHLATVDGADYGWDFTTPFTLWEQDYSTLPVDEGVVASTGKMLPEHHRVLSSGV